MKNPPYPEIPEYEYTARLSALQREMSREGLDAVLFFCEENQAYWSGYRRTYESPTVQWTAMLVPQQGDPTIVIRHGHYSLCNKTSHVPDVRPFGGTPYWKLPEDPIALVAEVIRERLPANAVIGAELGPGMHMKVSFSEFARLQAAIAPIRLIDSVKLLFRLKAVKTAWEIDLYRTIGDITAKGFLAGLMTVREGVTERDVMKAMMRSWMDDGAFDTPDRSQVLMRSGPGRYDMFTARALDRKLERGDQIFLDSGPCYKGYLSDIQRMGAVGTPPPLCMGLFEQSRVGLEAALAAIRPGVRANEVFQAASDAMLRVGANPHVPWVFFGHSIGLTNHELPFIVPTDETPLQAGMVLSIEVPAYDVPEFRVLGAFLEDVVLVTDSGCEVLTSKCPRDYWISRD